MHRVQTLVIIILVFIVVQPITACTDITSPEIHSPEYVTPSQTNRPIEYPVINIALSGLIDTPNAEISGMDWYKETLILLPQYPQRFGDGKDGALFALSKNEIRAYITGEKTTPLKPATIPFSTGNITEIVDGYEGFESIAFNGDRVYLTIESKPDDMAANLISGKIDSNLSNIILETENITEILPQSSLTNMSDEALLISGNNIFTFYEANGNNVNPNPVVHLNDFKLDPKKTIPMVNIEYRITDVTKIDDNMNFWAINYFYPGDTKLRPSNDILVETFGQGDTHSKSEIVERLVEFHISNDSLELSGNRPIQLELSSDDIPRNWEAIARFDNLGFILATDKYPKTILAFVAITQ